MGGAEINCSQARQIRSQRAGVAGAEFEHRCGPTAVTLWWLPPSCPRLRSPLPLSAIFFATRFALGSGSIASSSAVSSDVGEWEENDGGDPFHRFGDGRIHSRSCSSKAAAAGPSGATALVERRQRGDTVRCLTRQSDAASDVWADRIGTEGLSCFDFLAIPSSAASWYQPPVAGASREQRGCFHAAPASRSSASTSCRRAACSTKHSPIFSLLPARAISIVARCTT